MQAGVSNGVWATTGVKKIDATRPKSGCFKHFFIEVLLCEIKMRLPCQTIHSIVYQQIDIRNFFSHCLIIRQICKLFGRKWSEKKNKKVFSFPKIGTGAAIFDFPQDRMRTEQRAATWQNVFLKPRAEPNFVRVLPRRENDARNATTFPSFSSHSPVSAPNPYRSEAGAEERQQRNSPW